MPSYLIINRFLLHLYLKTAASEDEDDDDDDDEEENDDEDEEQDEEEGGEPSWEKQEVMVRRLQKKFPDQDKEVL